MVIGQITYTQGQLLALLPSGALHTGGYVNALSQFIAAVLNLTAGAKHASIDTTVSTINSDLAGITFVSGTGTALDPYKLFDQRQPPSYSGRLREYARQLQ